MQVVLVQLYESLACVFSAYGNEGNTAYKAEVSEVHLQWEILA